MNEPIPHERKVLRCGPLTTRGIYFACVLTFGFVFVRIVFFTIPIVLTDVADSDAWWTYVFKSFFGYLVVVAIWVGAVWIGVLLDRHARDRVGDIDSQEGAMRKLTECLSRSYPGGPPDLAERHNEHQP